MSGGRWKRDDESLCRGKLAILSEVSLFEHRSKLGLHLDALRVGPQSGERLHLADSGRGVLLIVVVVVEGTVPEGRRIVSIHPGAPGSRYDSSRIIRLREHSTCDTVSCIIRIQEFTKNSSKAKRIHGSACYVSMAEGSAPMRTWDATATKEGQSNEASRGSQHRN